MSKSAWDYTLEILSLMGDIDYYNDLLSKNLNKKEREGYSKNYFNSSKISSISSSSSSGKNTAKNCFPE